MATNLTPQEVKQAGFQQYISCMAVTVISIGVVLYILRWAWPRMMAAIMAYLTKKCSYASKDLKTEMFATFEDLKKQLGDKSQKFVVLEIGAGTGSNFQFFPKDSQVIALEPNKYCSKYLSEHADEWKHVQLQKIITGKAEDMRADIKDGSIDAVVCTLVLCSVTNVKEVLAEVKRVLKTNGRFYFLEHVEDPKRNSWTHIGQRFFYPFFKYIGDCDLLNTNYALILRAGFKEVTYKHKIAPKPTPFFFKPQVLGYAVK